MEIEIVPLQARHISSVVLVHLKAFPGFFLSFLGPRFLKEFYTAFVNEESSIGLIAVDAGGQVAGAVVGTMKPAGFFRRLVKRRWWAFCLASMDALMRRPAIALRLFRAVFYRGNAPPDAPFALLSSIAVDPVFQNRGVGRMLLNQFIKQVTNRESMGCYLATDAEGNDAVNRFYLKNGWRVESCYITPEGRKMNRLVWEKGK